MTSGEPVDLNRTLKQIESSVQSVKERPNWLRHSPGSQAAAIDQMILEGKYTIQDMADILDEEFGVINRKIRIKRIENHFGHLQDLYNGSMKPHRLRLKNLDGIWKFDVKQMRCQQ